LLLEDIRRRLKTEGAEFEFSKRYKEMFLGLTDVAIHNFNSFHWLVDSGEFAA